ncbi:MAG: nonstructural protein [Microvirus sp.]|nr:MAG: nonstructural protein [Microvirus sp.]
MLQAYSIYDRKSLQYHPPFYASADGAAARSFQDAINDPQSALGRHPMDYVLFHVGTFSDQNGSLEPALPVRHVVDASALVAPTTPGPLFSAPKGAANGHVENLHTDKE